MVTAEVAVNNASIQLTCPLLAIGSLSNNVPNIINARNPNANKDGGLKFSVLCGLGLRDIFSSSFSYEKQCESFLSCCK